MKFNMSKRSVIGTIATIVVVTLLGLFVVYGVPFIRDIFTPPITGLPTSSAVNSLQARFTQTAAAKQGTIPTSVTPTAQ